MQDTALGGRVFGVAVSTTTTTDAFQSLFEQCVLIAYDHQIHLNPKVHAPWRIDMESGTLAFNQEDGSQFITPVQLLGTQSDHDGTFLWAWANDKMEAPADVLRAANQLRALGQQHGIAELVEPMLSGIEVHTLGMVAVGLTGAPAYYRAPYQGGAALMLMMGEDVYEAPESPVVRVATLLGHLLDQVTLTHPLRSLLGWAKALGLEESPIEHGVRLTAPDGSWVDVELDTQGRIGRITAEADNNR